VIQKWVYVPSHARVFLLEDDPTRIEWFKGRFAGSLRSGNLHMAKDADSAIQAIAREEPFDVLFLDHDLSIADQGYRLNPAHEFNSGSTFARSFVEAGFVAKNIVIHSWNPGGAANMAAIFERHGSVAAYLPFGTFDIRVVK
jgi:hypothetical protein